MSGRTRSVSSLMKNQPKQKSTKSLFLTSPGVLRDVTTHFIVDGRSLSKLAGNHVKVRIINPSGANTDAYITDKGDGTFRVEYTAFEDGRSSRPPRPPTRQVYH